MSKKKRAIVGKKKSITLRDVIAHIQGVKNSLSEEIQGMKGEMQGMKGDIRGIKVDMHSMERRLSAKIDRNSEDIITLGNRVYALSEDLTATIRDTIKIRAHVGIPIAED